MREYEESDQAEEEIEIPFELGYPQEEADRDLRDGQRYKDLDPVKVVVFEETFKVVVKEVSHMSSETVTDFQYHKAHAYRIDHLPPC